MTTTLFGSVYPRIEARDANLSEAEATQKFRVPAGGTLVVKVQDTMRADAAARDVAGVEIALKPDSEWPQHFVIPLDTSTFAPHTDLTISARVEKDGKLWGLNDHRILAVKGGQVQRNGEIGLQVELKVI